MPGTDLGYASARTEHISGRSVSRRSSPLRPSLSPTALPACYALSGTDVAYAAAMRSTVCWVLCAIRYCRSLRCYSQSGTDVAYGVTTRVEMSPVKKEEELLRAQVRALRAGLKDEKASFQYCVCTRNAVSCI
eukprot:3014208-Rhodomonas_salina.1